MYHYVYEVTNKNSGMRYIGVRSSKTKPELDLGTRYFSSSKTLIRLIEENVGNFEFKILNDKFKTRKEAVAEEIRLHTLYNVGKNPKFYNKAKQTSTSFDVSGRVSVRNIETGETSSVTTEELKNNPDKYESAAKGLVMAQDLKEGINCHISREEYDKNPDRYVGVTKNRVSVRNKLTGEVGLISKEEFYSNKNIYSALSSGRISVRIKGTEETCSVTKEEYRNNLDRYVGITKGLVTVRNLVLNKREVVSSDSVKTSSIYLVNGQKELFIFDGLLFRKNLLEIFLKEKFNVSVKSALNSRKSEFNIQAIKAEDVSGKFREENFYKKEENATSSPFRR